MNDPKDWTPDQSLRADANRYQFEARYVAVHEVLCRKVGLPSTAYIVEQIAREFADARVSADRGARSQAEQELRQIDLAFGNVSALEGLTRAEKAAKCVKMLAALNAPAELSDSRAPREGATSNASHVGKVIQEGTVTFTDDPRSTPIVTKAEPSAPREGKPVVPRESAKAALGRLYNYNTDPDRVRAERDRITVLRAIETDGESAERVDALWGTIQAAFRPRHDEGCESKRVDLDGEPYDCDCTVGAAFVALEDLAIIAKGTAPPVSQHEPSAQEKA